MPALGMISILAIGLTIDGHLPISDLPPLSTFRPWPQQLDAIWAAFGLFSFICVIPAEDSTIVTAQQQ